MTKLGQYLRLLSVEWEDYGDSFQSFHTVHTAYQAPIMQRGRWCHCWVARISLISVIHLDQNSSAVGYLRNDSLYKKWMECGIFRQGELMTMNCVFWYVKCILISLMCGRWWKALLCCLGFTVSHDQVCSTIRSTANIAQVQSLKTGSTGLRDSASSFSTQGREILTLDFGLHTPDFNDLYFCY